MTSQCSSLSLWHIYQDCGLLEHAHMAHGYQLSVKPPTYLNMETGGSCLPDYVASIQNIPYYSQLGCSPSLIIYCNSLHLKN